MKVLLFDLYATGHHLEYAGKLATALEARDPDVEVEFLAPGPAERQATLFEAGQVSHLYERSPLDDRSGLVPDREPFPTVARFLRTEVANPRWRIVRDVAEYVEAGEYDVVHALAIDKIHPHLACHFRDVETPVVATINGVFFKPVRAPLPPSRPLRAFLEAGPACGFARFAPPFLYKGSGWNRWFLDRCVEAGAFDRLLVHSREARADVLAATGADADRITVVPDPLEPWDGSADAKHAARERLDLPTEGTVLLLFGQLVEEKGIDAFLRALERYDGPPFAMVIAGSPVAVSREEIEETARRSAVDVRARLGFVPEEDVEPYFVAADGVVLPYERSFGAARTSGVFQKACAAGRPVLASDFGVFGRRVREWDLGLLREPGSPERIADGLRELVERGEDVHDAERTAAYASSQSFERLAEVAHETYRDVAGGEP